MKKAYKLILLLSGLFQIATAQNFQELKLDNKLSILNDRAFFNFPTKAVNSARPTDIMSADHNVNQETRIILDMGNMRMVFFAEELYSFGDNDFIKGVTKESEYYKHKTLTDKDQMLSVLSTPTVFDSTKNAILVNSLVVKTQDNSIFRISAYINPDAYKQKNEFITLSEKVFSTLTQGNRKTDLSAREEKVAIFGTKKDFKFSLPENYCITVDQKYDFQVTKVHKYLNYSDTNWLTLTIYTGHHPSYFYREYGFDQNSAKGEAGKFLGKEVDWLSFYDAGKKIYLKEQKIPGDKISEGLVVHIAMLSNRAVSIDELTKIVESVQLK